MDDSYNRKKAAQALVGVAMADMMSKRTHYSPPWADVSIIGIAGSSGSGKSTLSHAIVSKLNLPWVAILSMDSFYKTLDERSSRLAFQNDYDFDSPDALDFDVLVDRLRDLKAGYVSSPPCESFPCISAWQISSTSTACAIKISCYNSQRGYRG